MKAKRYPKRDEQKLAYRIAKAWVQGCIEILAARRRPAKLSDCCKDVHWVAGHIYEWEDEAEGGELYLTKSAQERIAAYAVREAGQILSRDRVIYSHIIEHWKQRKIESDAKAAQDAAQKKVDARKRSEQRRVERDKALMERSTYVPPTRSAFWQKWDELQKAKNS